MKTNLAVGLGILVLIVGLLIGIAATPHKDKTIINELENLKADYTASITAFQDALSQKNAEIASLTDQINTPVVPEVPIDTEATVEVTQDGFVIDELILGTNKEKTLSDREVSKLIDSVIDFMEDTFNIDESLYVKATPSINGNDFKEHSYLTFLEGGLLYKVTFEDSLNTSEISEDETLTFTFLGQEVKISSWVGDTIKFSLAGEKFLAEGDTYAVGDKTVLVEGIYENKVVLSVGKVSKIVSEGRKVTIDGVEMKIKEILYSTYDATKSRVTLIAGDDLIKEVSDGEEYAEDSAFEYVIGTNFIGLTLSEKFNELDDNDGFNALAYGESLCLPNDYLCVKYVGLTEEDTEEFKFDLDEPGIVRIRGNFVTDSKDYTKIYFDGTNFADDNDFETESLITETIYFGDSDLTFDSVSLKFSDIELSNDLDNIFVGGISIASEEDNYRTVYGIVIENPESSVEDNEFTLVIPENALTTSLLVY